jgi:N-acetylglucosamine kinase-like BadF-type ATPase
MVITCQTSAILADRRLSELAPLVFNAAGRGDGVARGLD